MEGCDRALWYILWLLYQNFTCSVFMGGKYSETFVVGQGVHQGAPLSMLLYTVINKDLLCQLQNMASGVDGVGITCPTYADDIALVSLYKPVMQRLLDICFQHSIRFKYSFNSSKSVLVIIGKDAAPSTTLRLGTDILTAVKKDKHLGVPLVFNKGDMADVIEDRISKARSSFHASLGIGSKRMPVPPVVSARLCQAVVMPQLLYGLELVDLTGECVEKLEKTQRYFAKKIQGLPDSAARPTVLTTLGWKSVWSVLMLRRLMLLWQILLLPANNIYKQVVIGGVLRCYHDSELPCPSMFNGPVILMYNAARYLNLHEEVLTSILMGRYVDKQAWKRAVCGAIHTKENEILCGTSQLYPSLATYRLTIQKVDMWSWWRYTMDIPKETLGCRTMLRLLTNTSVLNVTADGQIVLNRRCDLCTDLSRLTVTHVLFVCPALNVQRLPLWQSVMESCPPALSAEFLCMDPLGRTTLILSGLNGGYIKEWRGLFDKLLMFVCKLVECYVDKMCYT